MRDPLRERPLLRRCGPLRRRLLRRSLLRRSLLRLRHDATISGALTSRADARFDFLACADQRLAHEGVRRIGVVAAVPYEGEDEARKLDGDAHELERQSCA